MSEEIKQHEGLRERYQDYHERQRKKYQRFAIAGTSVLFICLTILFTVLSARFAAIQGAAAHIDPSWPNVCKDLAVARDNLFIAFFRGSMWSLFVWVYCPSIFGVGCILFFGYGLLARISRRLYLHPAVAGQLLRIADSFDPIEHKWKHPLCGMALLLGTLIAWGLPAGFSTRFFHTITLAFLAGFFVVVWWAFYWHERGRGRLSTVSPTYARRSCLMSCLLVVFLFVAISLSLAQLQAWHSCWKTFVLPTRLAQFESEVSDWQVRLSEVRDRETRVPLIIDWLELGLQQNTKELPLFLAESPIVPPLKAIRGNPESLAILFLVVSLLLLGAIGSSLWRLEVRRPTRALMLTLVCVVVLELIANAANSAFEQHEIAGYLARLAITLLIYIAGQVSAFAIRLSSEKAEICPRCSFPVFAGERCGTCGTLVEKLQAELLVGNVQSLELHTADCHYARNLPESRSKTFANVEDAYWEGYDNCGICLKGSDYKWEIAGQ